MVLSIEERVFTSAQQLSERTVLFPFISMRTSVKPEPF
jgi:hypothetical protein